ncbi:MAG: 2-C-methyl-D-erythritol 4-phosphate cytidylyltransferase [Halanaerobiales bacterium]
MNIGAVIPAAGQGRRMQSSINKQFLELDNKPLLAHTIDKFYNNPKIEQIIVVVRSTERDYCQKNVLDKYGFTDVKLVAGGKTRKESVYAGLMAFSPAINYVIIHDGARPFLSNKVLNKVITAMKKYPAITTGVNVKDTIKVKSRNLEVAKTLDREKLIAVQTPQAFLYELIVEAHKKWRGTTKATDDASLVENLEQKVKIIKGDYKNIKITTPVDLLYAEAIIEKQKYN